MWSRHQYRNLRLQHLSLEFFTHWVCVNQIRSLRPHRVRTCGPYSSNQPSPLRCMRFPPWDIKSKSHHQNPKFIGSEYAYIVSPSEITSVALIWNSSLVKLECISLNVRGVDVKWNGPYQLYIGSTGHYGYNKPLLNQTYRCTTEGEIKATILLEDCKY